MELSEAFWMAVLASGCGIIGLIIKRLSASKCDEINMCGVHIHRKVELEKDMDEEKQESGRSAVL